MRTLIILAICLSLGLNFCSVKNERAEFNFANQLAQKGLYKEALMRYKRVQDAGENSAAIHNNMAVALEALGKTGEAEKEYQKALAISPNNYQIKNNFDNFQKRLKGELPDDPEKEESEAKNEFKKKREE